MTSTTRGLPFSIRYIVTPPAVVSPFSSISKSPRMPFVDARSEQVARDRRARPVGGRDRVEQHLGGLSRGYGVGVGRRADRLLECPRRTRARTAEAGRRDDREADHHALCCRPVLSDERREVAEAVRARELDVAGRGPPRSLKGVLAVRRLRCPPRNTPSAPERLMVLRKPGEAAVRDSPSRPVPAISSPSSVAAVRTMHRDRDSVGLVSSSTNSRVSPELLRHQRDGCALDVVRGHDPGEAANAARVVRSGSPGAAPGPLWVRPTLRGRAADLPRAGRP